MNEHKKYYKITTSNNKSAFTFIIPYCSVQYIPGEWVISTVPYSKLFVFDNLESARLYCGGRVQKSRIWECEVKNPTRIKNIAFTGSGFNFNRVVNFWKQKRQKKKYYNSCRVCNAGVVVCDAVKLVKLIKKVV